MFFQIYFTELFIEVLLKVQILWKLINILTVILLQLFSQQFLNLLFIYLCFCPISCITGVSDTQVAVMKGNSVTDHGLGLLYCCIQMYLEMNPLVLISHLLWLLDVNKIVQQLTEYSIAKTVDWHLFFGCFISVNTKYFLIEKWLKQIHYFLQFIFLLC